jgi:hypothetical protein
MNDTYSPAFLFGRYRTADQAVEEFVEVLSKDAVAWFLNDPDARQPCGWEFQRKGNRGAFLIEKNAKRGEITWLAWVVFIETKFATRKDCELSFPEKSIEEWTVWQSDELSLATGNDDSWLL